MENRTGPARSEIRCQRQELQRKHLSICCCFLKRRDIAVPRHPAGRDKTRSDGRCLRRTARPRGRRCLPHPGAGRWHQRQLTAGSGPSSARPVNPCVLKESLRTTAEFDTRELTRPSASFKKRGFFRSSATPPLQPRAVGQTPAKPLCLHAPAPGCRAAPWVRVTVIIARPRPRRKELLEEPELPDPETGRTACRGGQGRGRGSRAELDTQKGSGADAAGWLTPRGAPRGTRGPALGCGSTCSAASGATQPLDRLGLAEDPEPGCPQHCHRRIHCCRVPGWAPWAPSGTAAAGRRRHVPGMAAAHAAFSGCSKAGGGWMAPSPRVVSPLSPRAGAGGLASPRASERGSLPRVPCESICHVNASL